MANWYYNKGSEKIGPVDEQTIRRLMDAGHINGETYLWQKGMDGWKKAKTFNEFSIKECATQNINKDEDGLSDKIINIDGSIGGGIILIIVGIVLVCVVQSYEIKQRVIVLFTWAILLAGIVSLVKGLSREDDN